MQFKPVPCGLVLLIAIIALTTGCQASSDACCGGDAVLKPEGSVWRGQLWYGVSAEFGGKLPARESSFLEVVDSHPADACGSLERESVVGMIPNIIAFCAEVCASLS